MKFEIRQIDAWREDENCWTWNESYHISEYTTTGNEKNAFIRNLHKLGIVCKHGSCVVMFDGDIYELQNRKTHEPLFAAIPIE